MPYFVYMLASKRNGTLYIGVTNDLCRRAREKQIKGWNRAWKIQLIEANNSGWNDLAPGLV